MKTFFLILIVNFVVQRCAPLTLKKCQLSGGQLKGYNCNYYIPLKIPLYRRQKAVYSFQAHLPLCSLRREHFHCQSCTESAQI